MSHNYKIKRPLVFFDFESTGPDKNKDRIVQFCFVSMYPDGTQDTFTHLVNPEMPISASATEVHHITNEMVHDLPNLNTFIPDILNRILDVDLVGFGCLMFDVPLLFNELQRCGYTWDYTQTNIIDACNIFKRHAPRDLTAAFKHYTGLTMVNAHDAEADVLATKSVFLAQWKELQPGTNDLASIALISNYDKPLVDLSGKFAIDDDGELLINFGTKRGEKAKDNLGLLQWMLDKDFSEDAKLIARKIIDEENARVAQPSNRLPF